MQAALEAARVEVARVKTVGGSVKLLLQRLAADIEANKGNPAELQIIANDLKSHTDEIVADVVAHTPAEQEPAPNA